MMRTVRQLAANATLALLSVLVASCGGGGGSDSPPAPRPTVTLDANPTVILSGQTTQLTWSSTNATSCVASDGWSGTLATSGSRVVGPLTAQVTTFTLTCTGAGGSTTISIQMPITPPLPPAVNFGADRFTVTIGETVRLSWGTSLATSCTASGGWSGSRPTSGEETTPPLLVSTTFTLTCTGPGGTNQASIGVSVQPLPVPEIFLSADRSQITAGSAVTLTWTTANATSCVASGGWSGPKPTAGSERTPPLTVTTQFNLSCVGPGGTAQITPTITVTGPNVPPIANAGADRVVYASTLVALSGASSSDTGGGLIAAYTWTQIAGPAVTLSNANAQVASFVAPAVASDTTLTFRLIVTDDAGAPSAADTVNVVVRPLPVNTAALNGKITYARVPFATVLDYDATRQEPSRGITVQVMQAGTQQVLLEGQTDAEGNYSLAVARNTSVFVRAVARMSRAGTAPSWRFEVNGAIGGDGIYFFAGPTINTGAGAVQDLAIPSGWNASTRIATGPRSAAPFAILDTVYRAYNTVLSVAPTADFPPLVLNWSPANVGGQTFYSNLNNSPRIVLSGEADVDTDEYDTHVIAHEFGHYVEDIFARADSIGGPHAIGDRLDPRVAFGEGFASAFAGIAMQDPLYFDSFGFRQLDAATFSVEGLSFSSLGWFSESSAWSIVWDVFDSRVDVIATNAQDTVALGLQPIWQAMTGAQRTTPAATSIFPLMVALKEQNPGSAADIDTLVRENGIVGATMDAFGSTETNAAGSPDVLPIYSPIVIGGGPVTLRSVDTFGTPNKLSNHRFLRLEVAAAPRSARVVVTAPAGRDADLVVYRRGVEVGRGEAFGNEDFTVQLPEPGTYVLDVYDCDNAGCPNVQPPAITEITVTITDN